MRARPWTLPALRHRIQPRRDTGDCRQCEGPPPPGSLSWATMFGGATSRRPARDRGLTRGFSYLTSRTSSAPGCCCCSARRPAPTTPCEHPPSESESAPRASARPGHLGDTPRVFGGRATGLGTAGRATRIAASSSRRARLAVSGADGPSGILGSMDGRAALPVIRSRPPGAVDRCLAALAQGAGRSEAASVQPLASRAGKRAPAGMLPTKIDLSGLPQLHSQKLMRFCLIIRVRLIQHGQILAHAILMPAGTSHVSIACGCYV